MRQISTNPEVELIHVSLDREKAAAITWAGSFRQPWPTILPGDDQKEALAKAYGVRAVPTYVLVDRDGKEITRGKEASLKRAGIASP